jgi:hypothetical protein
VFVGEALFRTLASIEPSPFERSPRTHTDPTFMLNKVLETVCQRHT